MSRSDQWFLWQSVDTLTAIPTIEQGQRSPLTNRQSPQQGQPINSGHPPLVVTDNASHHPRPKETSQCTTWGKPGGDGEGADLSCVGGGGNEADQTNGSCGNLWTPLLFSLTLPRTLTTPKP
ncbi:MAG: hypothetical protein GY832_16930, partial [Chloroflexi bacterium]|nr:hypothetical protein [Chloroflexota bacterium]